MARRAAALSSLRPPSDMPVTAGSHSLRPVDGPCHTRLHRKTVRQHTVSRISWDPGAAPFTGDSSRCASTLPHTPQRRSRPPLPTNTDQDGGDHASRILIVARDLPRTAAAIACALLGCNELSDHLTHEAYSRWAPLGCTTQRTRTTRRRGHTKSINNHEFPMYPP